MRKKLIIIAGVLLLIGTIGAFATYPTASKATEEITIQDSFTSVHVDIKNVDIEIASSTNNETKVELIGGRKDDNQLDARVEEDELKVDYKTKTKKWLQLGLPNSRLKVSLPKSNFNEVTVEGAYSNMIIESLQGKNIHISTKVGEIIGKQIEASQLTVQTNTGDTLLQNTSGELTINSSVGDISVKGHKGEQTTIENKTGSIALNDLEGELNINTSTGDITMSLNRVHFPITTSSKYGDIVINIKEELDDVLIDAYTKSGDVLVLGNNRQHFEIGEGTNQIHAETLVGDIIIKQK